MNDPTWIRFEESPNTIGRKTKLWNILAKEDDFCLGQVRWHGPWRRYCFCPSALGAVFEQYCLRDIANFIESQTKEHKTGRTGLEKIEEPPCLGLDSVEKDIVATRTARAAEEEER